MRTESEIIRDLEDKCNVVLLFTRQRGVIKSMKVKDKIMKNSKRKSKNRKNDILSSKDEYIMTYSHSLIKNYIEWFEKNINRIYIDNFQVDPTLPKELAYYNFDNISTYYDIVCKVLLLLKKELKDILGWDVNIRFLPSKNGDLNEDCVILEKDYLFNRDKIKMYEIESLINMPLQDTRKTIIDTINIINHEMNDKNNKNLQSYKHELSSKLHKISMVKI